jgi:parvulin-like peptidyl-prolyl isomerase
MQSALMGVKVALLASALLCGAFDGPRSELADRIVGRVNNASITLSELEEAAARRRISDAQARWKGLRSIYEEELNFLIDEELLFQAAEKQMIEAPEEAVAGYVDGVMKEIEKKYGSDEEFEAALEKQNLTMDKLRERLRRREERDLKIARALQGRFTISDAEVEEFASQLREQGQPAVAYRLRHILIACPADAAAEEVEKARNRALQAAIATQSGTPFADVAREFSEHEPTRADGGDLGFVSEGKMEPALEEAAGKLEIGEISQPARSDLGFHILYLQEKRTPRKTLFGQRLMEERAAWIEELRRSETIEIMPGFLDEIPDVPAELLTNGRPR